MRLVFLFIWEIGDIESHLEKEKNLEKKEAAKKVTNFLEKN